MAYFPFDRGRVFQRASAHAASGVGRRVRREDLGAVLPQVRPQPPGRDRGPHGDDQARRTCSRTSAAAWAACRTRRCESGWRSSWIHFPPTPPPGRRSQPSPRPTVVLSAAILDRYVGEYTAASGFIGTFRREGDKLFVKLRATIRRSHSSRGPKRASSDPRGRASSSSSSTARER